MTYDLAVIGGGASGVFGAIAFAQKSKISREVIVLEKSFKLLSKVKVSGGGRCNVTHAIFEKNDLVKNYPRGEKELQNEFAIFSTTDTLKWFEERGVKIKSESDGRMFPVSNSSQTIIDCLQNELTKHKISVEFNFGVYSIVKLEENFAILSSSGKQIISRNILIACGGFSKSEQYGWLTELGHSIEIPVPSLFTFNLPDAQIKLLMGVSVKQVNVKLSELNISYSGPVLITHWGLSGPSVLKLSAYGARKLFELNYQYKVAVNWLNDTKVEDVINRILDCKIQFLKKNVQNLCPFNEIPERLWHYFLQQCEIDPKLNWSEIPKSMLNKLAEIIVNSVFQANGKTTYKEEFVTAGGIKLKEINMKTMESKLISGIYFSGEIMNIDGITGGFNFQHAWSSGFIAGSSIANKYNEIIEKKIS